MSDTASVRVAEVFAAKGKPVSPLEREPVVVDLATGPDGGTLDIHVCEPKTSHLTNLESSWVDNPVKPSEWEKSTMPLVAVNGTAVSIGQGRARVYLDSGEHLVEVMDDHHYVSRTVAIAAKTATALWLGFVEDQRAKTFLIGDRAFVERKSKRRFPPTAKVGGVIFLSGIACVIGGVALAAYLASLFGFEDHSWLALLGLPAMALPALFYDPLKRYFEKRAHAQLFDSGDLVTPEYVGPSVLPGQGVHIAPPGATPPANVASIYLRLNPNRDSLHLIGFWARGLRDRRKKILFYSNSHIDWMIAPQVSVNGHLLPERWGNWFIPVRPGVNRLQVTLRGFRDPSTGESYEFTSPVTERFQVEVAEGASRLIDCEYNSVALVRERVELYPHTEPFWYQVMRRAAAINTPKQDFDTHIALEAAQIPKLEFHIGRQL